MKSANKLIIVLITFLALATSAHAQSPREQLNQMAQQLQKTPNDNALREKIIKLSTSIKPAPAIPENAREPFVMGATVLKKASDPAGASKAVDLFTQALTIAPWFADAYYNRAMAREAAGQYEPAIGDLKLYLGFKLTDAERREAQDKIYSLKADAQLASTKKAEQDKIASAEAAKRDVITKIKNAVGNRTYEASVVSYNSDPRDIWSGVSQNELFGGGQYYVSSAVRHLRWKFFDDRVELWGRWGAHEDGAEYLECVGEPWGQDITSMRWFDGQMSDGTKSDIWREKRVWGHFDSSNGYFFLTKNGTKPFNDSEGDPNKRYIIERYKPL